MGYLELMDVKFDLASQEFSTTRQPRQTAHASDKARTSNRDITSRSGAEGIGFWMNTFLNNNNNNNNTAFVDLRDRCRIMMHVGCVGGYREFGRGKEKEG